MKYLPEVEREADVPDIESRGEQRGNVGDLVARDAATDTGDEEGELGMLAGESDETVDVFAHGIDAFHGGYGIALPLQAIALAEDGAETLHGGVGGAATVHARGIAAEDEYLTLFERGDAVGGDAATRLDEFEKIGIGRVYHCANFCTKIRSVPETAKKFTHPGVGLWGLSVPWRGL